MLNSISTSSFKPLQLSTVSSSGSQPAQSDVDATASQSQRLATTSGTNLLASRTASMATVSGATLNEAALNTLKKPPFKPTDVNLFRSQVYSNATIYPPAPSSTLTTTQAKAQLTKIFTKRFNGNTSQVNAAVALMDDATLKKVAPDPKLRAAIVNLKGTAGESALTAYRNGTFSSVKFADLGSGVGISLSNADGTGKPWVQINSRYKGEDFQLLTHTMAHEALHQDQTNSLHEERMATAMTLLIYGQQVVENPSLALEKTELTQRMNTALMARLNSRDAQGNLRIFTSQGNVYPGGRPLANFGAAFTPNSNPSSEYIFKTAQTSRGNAVLQGMLKAVTGQSVTSPNFNYITEGLLDQGQKVMTPVQLVALAKALKLQTT